jgi:transposase
MSGKYFIECSRCHRMIGLILNKMMTDLQRRCFTCSECEKEIKGNSQ